MKAFLALLFVVLCAPAQATVTYVSDCGTGADGACVAGANANPGTNPTSPKQTCAAALAVINAATAGDQILFAKGGAWDACQLGYIQSLTGNTNRRANPIVIGNYVPSWGPGTARPRLNGAAGVAVVSFYESAADGTADEGYTLQGLELRGGTGSSQGVQIGQRASYIIIDNMMIDGTASSATNQSGVNCFDYLPTSGTQASHHILISNSTIKGWGSAGVFSACSNTVIDSNTFLNNSFGTGTGNHHIYLASQQIGTTEVTSYGMIIRRNTLTDNSTSGAGFCTQDAIEVHGDQNGLQITDNRIEETVTGTVQCWAITVDSGYNLPVLEAFRNVQIARNVIKGFAQSIAIDECQSCVIEANQITASGLQYAGPAITADATAAGIEKVGDLATQRTTIKNNTIYYPAAWTNSVAIALPDSGAGHIVANNLIYFGAGTDAGSSCFDAASYTPTYTYFDRNLCYYSGTAGKWEKTAGSLAAWKAAFPGRDTNSLTANPAPITLASATAYQTTIGSTSNARDAGSATYFSRLEQIGCTRSSADAAPDIGAYEYRSSGCTAAPPSPYWVK